MVVKGKLLQSEIPAGLENWVANRQVSAYFRIVEASIWGQLFNALVLGFAFLMAAPFKFGVVLLLAAQLGLFMHRQSTIAKANRSTDSTAPALIKVRIAYNSAGLATTYAIGTIWILPLAAPHIQILIAIAMTSMIGIAGFAFRYIPRSALSFVTIMAAGLIVAVLRLGTGEGAVCALVIGAAAFRIATMAQISSETFISRILRERELARSTETVKMLLNDFQDQGSDWLFELDGDARLVGVSPRFASALQTDQEDLNGRSFFDLFETAPEREQLEAHIAERRAFRGLSLPLAKSGAGRSVRARLKKAPQMPSNFAVSFPISVRPSKPMRVSATWRIMTA
jgi:PAS domain-containing protein